jgi:hypothetical protein
MDTLGKIDTVLVVSEGMIQPGYIMIEGGEERISHY